MCECACVCLCLWGDGINDSIGQTFGTEKGRFVLLLLLFIHVKAKVGFVASMGDFQADFLSPWLR